MKDVSHLVFAFFLASLFPAMISVFVFLKYFFTADSYDNRKHLQLGCGLMILSTIIQYIGIVVGALMVDSIPAQSIWVFFITNGLNVFNYVYFLIMCDLWTNLHSGELTHLLGNRGASNRGGGVYMSGGQVNSAFGGDPSRGRQ